MGIELQVQTIRQFLGLEVVFEAIIRGALAEGSRHPDLHRRARRLTRDRRAEDLRATVSAQSPDAIVNLTAFSGRGAAGASVLDAAGVPVFQAALATSTHAAWQAAERGLSPADLAMHVVLPEVDGRLMGGVVSFKAEAERDPDLQFARRQHRPVPERIAALVARVGGWLRLAGRAPAERRLALVLSTYPGRDWNLAHAVGLDALASAQAILEDLCAAGHIVEAGVSGDDLKAARLFWPLEDYKAALACLPEVLQEDLATAWGAPAPTARMQPWGGLMMAVNCLMPNMPKLDTEKVPPS